MRFITLTWSGILTISVLALGLVVIKPVLAQVDATSTETVAASAESVTAEEAPADTLAGAETDAIEELPSDDAEMAATPDAAPSPEAASEISAEPRPEGLTEVHIIGTKYTDYFTDGTTEYSFPGDPEIHAHIAEPNAPIPTHGGLTWVHSTGSYLYDTASGDLEVGQYALQENGSYIVKRMPFVSSTTTAAALDVSTSITPESSSTATTTANPTDTIAPAHTSAESVSSSQPSQ